MTSRAMPFSSAILAISFQSVSLILPVSSPSSTVRTCPLSPSLRTNSLISPGSTTAATRLTSPMSLLISAIL
ncbi:Uncharacterised protein [uncultured archaeon]|nr:Uncharacterised protein [uncultured archaeon]